MPAIPCNRKPPRLRSIYRIIFFGNHANEKDRYFPLMAIVSTGVSAVQTVRFAIEVTYAPFEFVGTCTFTNQAFDNLIPSPRFHRFDAVISSMDITSDRQKQAAFTQPYYENSAVFVAQKGKFANLASLAGRRIGMQNGSTHQKYLMDKHPEITAVPYNSYQNAFLDLKNGRLDNVFGDTAVVKMADAGHQLGDHLRKVTDQAYFGTSFDVELVDKFNQALDKVCQAAGTILGLALCALIIGLPWPRALPRWNRRAGAGLR
ncbi:MAG: hypothetical protein GPOALKHO_000797 [Sodalis sp.]|nr:MAG: hypothetical protein GPOALKHO_000797 [Sodalis sp.]